MELKVGKWWNKFDAMQKESFIAIWKMGTHDINDIRKFITAARGRFQYPIYGYFTVTSEGKIYAYSGMTNSFYKVTNDYFHQDS